MPQTVIDRVNKLSKDQPEQFIFTDRKGRLIGDIELPSSNEDDDLTHDNHAEIPGVDRGEIETLQEVEAKEPDTPVIGEPRIEIDILPDDNQEHEPPLLTPVPDAQEPTPIQIVTPDEIPGVRRSTRVKFQPKQDYIPSMTGSSKYAYAGTQLETQGVLHPDLHMFHQSDVYYSEPDVVAAIMTQLSLKAGLKAWGKDAQKAVHLEMKQLHFRDTSKPMRWTELTRAQHQIVLESHMFLKQKRTGTIKGRTVAGGNKQRDFISKEEVSSPTVATEAVLLSCIIGVDKRRDVAVIDIPNAFIQTQIEDEKDMAIIKIKGVLVDMLLDIAPTVYTPYVTTDWKGAKQLIVQCQNAIYRTMMASLLYYKKFSKSLKSVGFEFNPYNPCVANKQISGQQMTICFHVDNFKLSHKSPKVNDRMIRWLKREYESIFEDGSGEMSVSRGKIHTYLGMTLDYTLQGRVMITMFEYINEIISAYDKADPKGGGTKTSAAPENLFWIDDDCKKLDDKKSKQFHNLVAKTLYAPKRARPDTCTAVAYLTTRVREPDTDDWKKLFHMIKYLRGTKTLPLVLSASGTGILKWWVDRSFTVHPGMRGHTGGGLTMG
jgi:hypothetical protein